MSHLTLVPTEPVNPKLATFGGGRPDSERPWVVGKHGSEYNLKGKSGGLDWDRLRAEHDAACDPETLARGEEAAKLIRSKAHQSSGRTRSQA